MAESQSERAGRFADTWYARPDSARDASTLGYLLTLEMAKVAEQARVEERQRIAVKLARLVEP
jgi:hypothetical protein